MKNRTRALGSFVFSVLMITSIVVGFVTVPAGITTAESTALPISEDFNTDNPDNWNFYGKDADAGESHEASSNVAVGPTSEPSLLLTQNDGNQAGTALYTQSFPSSNGITAEFRYYAAEGTGADGISFFLLNASKVDPNGFDPGASGGSLGYSGSDTEDGVPGGFLGIGFDEFGNFANSAECHEGGTGTSENSGVTIRGAGDRGPSGGTCSNDDTDGYPFLDHADPDGGAIDGGWRRVKITVDPTIAANKVQVRVEMSFDGGGTWETVIDDKNYTDSEVESGATPENFYLGFSGSTGGSTNVHAIDDLTVTKPADLTTTTHSTPSTTVQRGNDLTYKFNITNNGPNADADVNVSDSITTGSNGLANAQWSYETTDGDSDSGLSSPPKLDLSTGETATVTVTGTVGETATDNLTHTVSATPSSDFNDPSPSDAQTTVTINITNQPELNTSSGTTGYTVGSANATVDPDVNITDPTGNTIDGAHVVITENFSSANDTLSFNSSLASSKGISGSYDSSTGVLNFTGSASSSEYQAVLRSVTYGNSADNPANSSRTITFRLGDASLYHSGTGHYYEFVSSTGDWSTAESAASGKSKFGLGGYLVTVVSSAENDHVHGLITGDAWMGGSDDDTENTWKWKTGPEAGTTFWKAGSTITYANWNDGEPNNADTGQDYLQIYNSDGDWDDLEHSGSIEGYVIEYGGLTTDPNVTLGANKSISFESSTISSFRVENPSGQDVSVAFDSSEQITAIEVSISEAESATLTTADFTETSNDDDSYTYEATYSGSSDGTYTGTLDTAENSQGTERATGQSENVTVDASGPPINTFALTEAEGSVLKITIKTTEQLFEIDVSVDGPSGESATRNRIDFTETTDGGTYIYTAKYTAENTGEYQATLETASDKHGNDGAGGETANATLESPPESVGGARAATKDGRIFLGGDFLELGIRPDGGFGAEVTAPSSFFGSDRGTTGLSDRYVRRTEGQIGMYADVDGFYNDTHDFRYEYFIPGSPEERWSVGYTDGSRTTASNGRNAGESIPTSISNHTDSGTLRAKANSSYNGKLVINQTYEFQPGDRFYKTTVRLENVGGSTLRNVRYQRSFDPDNAKDLGCGYTTKNTVVHQQPNDTKSVVKGEIRPGDDCGVTDVSSIPIFYFSQDSDARVSYGKRGLIPRPTVDADRDWDNPPAAGSSAVQDTYIAITFNASKLASGETATFTYYTALTDDFNTTLADIEEDAGSPVENPNVTADAGADINANVGSDIEFNGTGTTADLAINSYNWSFGDGTTATGPRPTHSYESTGTYTVTLNVTDERGNFNTSTLEVTIRDAPAVNTTANTTEFVDTDGEVVVDDGINITYAGVIRGAEVSIDAGFDPDTDSLDATANHGISVSYDSETGVLTLNGPATAAEYESVLRTVTYNNSATDPAEVDRVISFNIGTGTVYSDSTGHYYEYVSDSGVTWSKARDAATKKDHFGLRGSLLTITSAAENEFVLDTFESAGWIGASDAGSESVWRWVTGPEGARDGGDGLHFFTQTAAHVAHTDPYPKPPKGVPGGGEAVGSNYTNWSPRHEPNNKFPMFGGQDYAYFCFDSRSCSAGQWMDLNGELAPEVTPAGYFVEYGGLDSDPNVTLSDTKTVTVTRDDPPRAVAGNNLTSVVDATIAFNASNSTDDFAISSYQWAFGDGNTSTGVTATHSYGTDGNFTVTLTVTDDEGQTATDTLAVRVKQQAVVIADAGANVTVNEDAVVGLDGSRSRANRGISSFEWALGDGSTALGEAPTHVYDDPGLYNLTLTVTDEESNTASDNAFVTVRDVTDPTAEAGADVSIAEGTNVTLNGSASSDNDRIASYAWDFTGNGRTDATGLNVSRQLDTPGNYTVTLTVTDDSGNTATDTVLVTVNDTTAPLADAGDNVTVDQGEPVSFDATNSSDNVAIESTDWDLYNNGTTDANASTFTHRYSAAGTYTVTLTTTDASGNTATDTRTVTVEQAPAINLTDGTTNFTEGRDPVVVDDALNLTYPSGQDLEGAEVSIEAGFQPGSDVLGFNRSLANRKGISGTYDSDTGVLSFTGSANASVYESVLRTVTYETTAGDPSEVNRTITFNVGAGPVRSNATGHYYEYVSDAGITWTDAKSKATDRYHHGLQGYLATITSAAENEFVADKLRGAGWIGASDADGEGTWRWVTGPEGREAGGDGRHFFTQTASVDGRPTAVYSGSTPGGGNAVSSEYENWDPNTEPNDWGSGEDYAHFCFDQGACPDGMWNDFAVDNPSIDGYVVEYGGMSGDPTLNLTDSKTVTVTSDDPPTAEAGNDVRVGTDDDIEFDASNSTDDFGIDRYVWTLGDGTTRIGETIVHRYGSDGNYTVTLTVTDTAAQRTSDTLGVTVINDEFLIANPGGNYSVDEDIAVMFNGSGSQASAGIADYEWTFGDGSTSTSGGSLTTPSHTYADPGTYGVTLTITDTLGNTANTTVYVHVADVTAPTAEAGANQTVDEVTEVTFNGSNSTDNGRIDSYEWDVDGDGRTDATGTTANHTYNEPGSYVVTLTTIDAGGNRANDTLVVTVRDNSSPTVDAGSDVTVELGEPQAFDGTGTNDDFGIKAYEWAFGDGNTSSNVTATHTYGSTGDYNATLTVNDTSGNVGTDSINVTVVDTVPTIGGFGISSPGGETVNVSFTSDQQLDDIAVAIGGAESATLTESDFTRTESNGTYTYTASYAGSTDGKYTATLTTAADATGNDGASNQSASLRTLGATVTASSFVTGVNTTVEFEADGSLPKDASPTYEWNVSGTGSDVDHTGQSIEHRFLSPGKTTVTLTVSTGSDVETASVTVTVKDRVDPTARLAAGGTVPNGTAASFNASRSTDDVNITSYEWTFGDGENATGTSLTEPSHTYTAPGRYTVTVTLSDAAGNSASNSTTVLVEGPYANVSAGSLAFGDTPVGSSSLSGITVRNTGTVPLNVTNASFGGTNPGAFALGDSVAGDLPVIPAGGTRSIPVNFTPASTGDVTATVELRTNHSNHTVSLSGAGVQSDLSTATSSLSFGSQATGSTDTLTVDVQNTGGAAATVDPTIAGVNSDQFKVTGPTSIDAGATVTYTVTFEPTAAYGQAATLQLLNDTDSTVISVPLNGTGVGPELAPADDTITYSAVGKGKTAPGELNLSNVGNQPLNITTVNITGANAELFTIQQQPASIADGATERLTVDFTPTAAGTYNASLVIESNDTDSPETIALTGEAVAAKIAADPRTLHFEDVNVSETGYLRILVKNLVQSKTDLSVSSTTLTGKDPEPFSIVRGGAPFTLTPGQQRYINLSYSPTTAGDKSAQLRIISDAGNEAQIDIWLSSTGTYVVVQEVAADDSNPNRSSVNIDANNVENGTDFSINVSQPGTRQAAADLQVMNMTASNASSFQINTTHSTDPVGSDGETYTDSDDQPVQYIRLNHTVNADKVFDNTSLTFRVNKSQLPSDTTSEEVSLLRWNSGWQRMTLTLVESTSTHYIYQSDLPGFSQFVVSAPKPASGGGGGSGSGDEGGDEGGDDGGDGGVPQQSTPATPSPSPADVSTATASTPTTPSTPDEAETVTGPATATASPTAPPAAGAPQIAVVPEVLQFLDTEPGERDTLTVTVTNRVTSNSELEVGTTQLTGKNPEAFSVVAGGAPFTLAPGEEQSITIAFTPQSAGVREAQLQIVSNAQTSQIDIWLTNKRSYIVVQEVDTDTEEDEETVEIEAVNIERDSDLVINISRPRTRGLAASVDTLGMRVTQGGNFTINVTHSDEPLSASHEAYSSAGRDVVQYVTLDYTIPSSAFQDTSFVFRVNASQLPAGAEPAAIEFYRFANGAWNRQAATLERQSGDELVFRVNTSGFSQFVVTAPSAADAATPSPSPGHEEPASAIWWLIGILALAGLLLLLILAKRRDDEEEEDELDAEGNETGGE